MMTPELQTLADLWAASCHRLYGPVDHTRPLDLYNAYRTLPKEHLVSLQRKGLWFVLSATQGNITQAGADALKAAQG